MKTKNTKKILAFALGALALSSFVLPSTSRSMGAPMPFMASAQVAAKNFDASMIEYDLADIDLDSQYPKDAQGKTDVIRFQEYMYSESDAYANSYGLYLYVYNPTEKPIRAMGNVANMAISYGRDGKPTDYENVALTLLDKTSDNRFLKFKVTDAKVFLEHAKIYASANDGARRYDVAGVQLYYADGSKSKDAKIANTYTWTGYAKGVAGEEETLSLACEPLKTLQLTTHPTYYRPTVSGEMVKKQQSLHSVYFSVPNDTLEEYGALYGVEAQFLNAVLKPMLYIEDEYAYTALQPYLGQTLSGHNEALPYQIASGLVEVLDPVISPLASFTHEADFAYNYDGNMLYIYRDDIYDAKFGDAFNDINIWNKYEAKDTLDTLYLLFHGADATNRVVSSEAIKKAMEASADDFGGYLIQGAEGSYSEKIFSSVDKEYTTLEKTADDSLSLEAELITQKWYERFWGLGGSNVEVEKIYSDLQCVYRVKDTDITGNVANDCAKLCIATADYKDFCDEYARAKENNETLYLFRYQVSDYTSQTATIMGETTDHYWGKELWCVENNPQGYFFSQTVNLDFDIIDVTLKDEDGATVLAVVSDPIDVVPDGTAPQDPNYKPPQDGNGCLSGMPWWGYALIILGALVFIFFVKPVLSVCTKIIQGAWEFITWLFTGIWYILLSPYYLVRLIVKKIKGVDKW